MLKISRELDLALLLMVKLTGLKPGESMSLSGFATDKHLPYRFLSKVAGKLKKAGLIVSKEGRDGGYGLSRKAKKIKAGQIFKAVEGKTAPVACLQGQKCLAQKFCKQRQLLSKLSRVMEKQLNQTSLEELCR